MEDQRMGRAPAVMFAGLALVTVGLAMLGVPTKRHEPVGPIERPRPYHDCAALIFQFLDAFENHISRLGIDTDRRFIEKNYRGIMNHRSGHIEAPFHSAGECFDFIFLAVFKACKFKRPIYAIFQSAAFQAVDFAKEYQVFAGCQSFV